MLSVQNIRELIENIRQRPFVRNVATIAAGTAVSQVIAILAAPVLTRLYGPEVYGVFGVFSSVVALFSIVGALSYPIAIVLPKQEGDALELIKVSLLLGVVISLLCTGVLYVYGAKIFWLLNAEKITAFMYLIPLAMYLAVLGSVLQQWLIRKKAFSVVAKYGAVTTLLASGVKIVFGLISPTAIVLVLTNLAGGIVSAGLTFFGWRRHASLQRAGQLNHSHRKASELLKEYKDFPLLRTPQIFINALSQSLPVLLLSTYFGAEAAGHYTIVITVLGVPAGLIGSSVYSVFYPRVSEIVSNGENVRALIIKATKGVALLGAVPLLVIVLFGPKLFSFVFGPQWAHAGVYAQWLAPWMFLQYVNKPAVAAIPALRLQGGLLLYELFSTGSKIFALWAGFILFKSDVLAVAFFSVVGIIAYLWLIFWVVSRSKSPRCYA